VGEIVKGIDKLSLAEGVDFVVTEEMRKGLEDEVLEELISAGVKPSEETGKKVAATVRTKLLERNLDKIIEYVDSVKEEKYKEIYREKYGAKAPLGSGNNTNDAEDTSPDAVIDRIFGNY
jgi:hypothetical protein